MIDRDAIAAVSTTVADVRLHRVEQDLPRSGHPPHPGFRRTAEPERDRTDRGPAARPVRLHLPDRSTGEAAVWLHLQGLFRRRSWRFEFQAYRTLPDAPLAPDIDGISVDHIDRSRRDRLSQASIGRQAIGRYEYPEPGKDDRHPSRSTSVSHSQSHRLILSRVSDGHVILPPSFSSLARPRVSCQLAAGHFGPERSMRATLHSRVSNPTSVVLPPVVNSELC